MQSPTIDSSEVTVEVAQGIVSLQGTVPERYMKHAIEDLVDSCLGVKDIDNRVRVQRDDTYASGSGSIGAMSSNSASATTGTSTKAGKE